MKLTQTLFLILVAIVFCSFSYADKKNTLSTLKDFARTMLHKKDQEGGYITAISLEAQCGDHKPVFVTVGTKGIRDLTPITKDSIFQIGSITKSFIAIVILEITKENKISLDDNTVIGKWFPEYPKWAHITLRQLMNMTSGIPGNENNLSDDIFKKFTLKEYTSKIEATKILDLTYQLPLHFKSGTRFEYSNTNYVLLGQFIKRITHHEPQDEVQQRVIDRLGLRSTYFVVDKGNHIPNVNKKQLVHGYAFSSKASKPYSFIPYGVDTLPYSLSYTNTAGAMASTPKDINMYLHSIFDKSGLFHRYQKQLTTLVSKQTGQPIEAPSTKDRQGFGFGILGYYWDSTHPLIYLYNGTTDGFNFAWFIDPKSQVYLVLAINSRADVLSLDDCMKLFSEVVNDCKIPASRKV